MARPVIDFDTAPFECSHMRAPRGFGSWAFALADTTDAVLPHAGPGAYISNDGITRFFTGTYAEAKKAARAWAVDVALKVNPACSYVRVLVLP